MRASIPPSPQANTVRVGAHQWLVLAARCSSCTALTALTARSCTALTAVGLSELLRASDEAPPPLLDRHALPPPSAKTTEVRGLFTTDLATLISVCIATSSVTASYSLSDME